MSIRSSVQIHAFTNGDVRIDQLVNIADNQNSCAIIYTQWFPPNVATIVFNPFIPLIGEPNNNSGIVSGVLIVPPVDNVYPYTLSVLDTPSGALFHGSNPQYISLVSLTGNLFINHANPNGIVIRFYWL